MFSILGRRRAKANRQVIERLHEQIVTAARHPEFYVDYGVQDTLDGRFELLFLMAALAIKRLREAEAPGPDVAQDLVDAVFRHLDSGLRELGVGDLTVPKRMKKLAGAFLGRSSAYDSALRGDGDLADALSRNIFNGVDDGHRMARYVAAALQRLVDRPLEECLVEGLPFPDPASVP